MNGTEHEEGLSPSWSEAPAREPTPEQTPNRAGTPRGEIEPQARPRIYVASLADYHAGRLHGTWLDAAVDHEELAAGIAGMLARSPLPDAEEWAIHDHSGFGTWALSEYEDLSVVAAVATAIAAHGPIVADWLSYIGSADSEALEQFSEAYLGHWGSMQEYLDQLMEDIGLDITVEPESWKHYISVDTDLVIADLEHQLYVIERADGSVDLFNPNVG